MLRVIRRPEAIWPPRIASGALAGGQERLGPPQVAPVGDHVGSAISVVDTGTLYISDNVDAQQSIVRLRSGSW
jgi:hypothetical protein